MVIRSRVEIVVVDGAALLVVVGAKAYESGVGALGAPPPQAANETSTPSGNFLSQPFERFDENPETLLLRSKPDGGREV
jgi:hypothetical protein